MQVCGWCLKSHKRKIDLKSATKPFNVLIACTCPLITELADKLRLKKTYAYNIPLPHNAT